MELLQILLLSPLNKENGYVQVPHSIQVLNQMINTFPWPGKSLCNLIQINESLTAMVCFTLIFMSTKFCVNVIDIFFPSECWKSFIQISERSKMSHFFPFVTRKKTSCFVWVLEVPQIQFQSSFIKNAMWSLCTLHALLQRPSYNWGCLYHLNGSWRVEDQFFMKLRH